MNKVWRIIKYEYHRHVFRKRFLISLLSLPLIVIVMVGFTLIIARFETNTSPVGYVDPSGTLDPSLQIEGEGSLFDPMISFNAYPDQEQARSALDAGDIQAYYVLPEDFPQTLTADLIYLEEPESSIQSQFNGFIRHNLMTAEAFDPLIEQRLSEGGLITVTTFDGEQEMREDQWYLLFTPFITGILFIMVVMTSGGYLLQAVVEEKENRTMEIMLTSVSPNQLMTGKVIGNIAVGLTQLFVWLIFGWIGLGVGGQYWPILQDFTLTPDYVLILLLILLPSFVMVAALMAAIGSTMTEMREAQQISSLFSMMLTIPFYTSSSLMSNPNGTLALVLSYFPLSSPLTVLMRMSFTTIPTYQLVIHIAILMVCAVFAIWFSGRAFHLGMLQYGKKISLREIFRKSVEA